MPEDFQRLAARIGRVPADLLGEEDPGIGGERAHLFEALRVPDPDVRAEQTRLLVDPVGDAAVIRADVVEEASGGNLGVNAFERVLLRRILLPQSYSFTPAPKKGAGGHEFLLIGRRGRAYFSRCSQGRVRATTGIEKRAPPSPLGCIRPTKNEPAPFALSCPG